MQDNCCINVLEFTASSIGQEGIGGGGGGVPSDVTVKARAGNVKALAINDVRHLALATKKERAREEKGKA